jgi:hypothetical protein
MGLAGPIGYTTKEHTSTDKGVRYVDDAVFPLPLRNAINIISNRNQQLVLKATSSCSYRRLSWFVLPITS